MTKFNKENLIKLLVKKASGFYYTEELCEYEKTQNNSKFDKNNSFFNNNVLKNNSQISFLDNEKPCKNKQNTLKNNEELTLVKKKITTHYISPDMLAIKILLEIYGKEMNDSNLSEISDSELINLKNKLIGELFNETNTDK